MLHRKLSGRSARAAIGRIRKSCPSCGGGFVFSVPSHDGEACRTARDFVRLLEAGIVGLGTVEDCEARLRAGRAMIGDRESETR